MSNAQSTELPLWVQDREEIWLRESQLCPNLAQDCPQQATKLF